MKFIFFLGFGLLLSYIPLFSQNPTTLRGIVTNEEEEPLIGATLQWGGTQIGTVTDTVGRFELPHLQKDGILLVRYVGYEETSVEVLATEGDIWVEVNGVSTLTEIEVAGKKFDNSVSTLNVRNVESISSNELKKAPCCNLSESFETNGTVDVAYPNAITGVKEIQMLGLKGTYSQFTLENRPTLYGLATPYAFELLPGTWLEGIQLAKGASTVKNGFAGFTGQINAELEKPHTAENPAFLNIFTSSGQRAEANLHLHKKGKKSLSHGVLLHASGQENRFDHNSDNFYDMLNRRQLNGLYRAFYETEEWCGQINVHALTDTRNGGQIRALPNGFRFPFDVKNNRMEVFAKLGKKQFKHKPYNSLGNILSFTEHRTDALIGQHHYAATQRSLYAQSLVRTIIGNTDHVLEFGGSFTADHYRERLDDTPSERTELIPGMMAEYAYNRSSLRLHGIPDLSVVVGLRLDYHSIFGVLATPRTSIKYNFNENSVVRASVGRGYRAPVAIAENISLLATNRPLAVEDLRKPEEAWNYGINFTQQLHVFGKDASFSVDAYRTDFVRQLLADQETNPEVIQLYFTEGRAFSNSLMALFQINPATGLDLKAAYKINDVQSTYADGQLRAMPLVARHRGLVTADYKTKKKDWAFHTSVQIIGPQRLPDLSAVPHEFRHDFPTWSPTFAVLNAQVTRSWKRLELYLGGENIGSYTQHHAILAAEQPDNKWFNGSLIYAPIFGRMGYAGLRWKM